MHTVIMQLVLPVFLTAYGAGVAPLEECVQDVWIIPHIPYARPVRVTVHPENGATDLCNRYMTCFNHMRKRG